MSERAYSVFAQVDARAEIERSLREAGFREIPEAGRWLNEAGQTPAQWAHGLPGGGRNPRHLVKTWGCQMNEHDSEIMAAQLELMGYEPTDEVEEADLILLNTCAIRHVAEEKVFGTIGWLKQVKDRNPDLILAMAGCMAQEPVTIERIKRTAPHVDVIFGTHNIHRLPELILRVRREEGMVVDVWKTGGAILENLPARRADRARAWVTIQYGCDKFCTYCIVPYVRGRERSRPPAEILREVAELGRQGYREVTLLGQTVSSYGSDFVHSDYRFADLIRDLESVEGIRWIRFMSPYPADFDDRLVEALARSTKVCRHVHLPVQSGSDRVLHRMNRRYTRQQFLDVVERLRQAIPGITITTDIIVGFPGETEEDFEETLDLVRRVRFDNAFTFWYSPRAGTVGAFWEQRQGVPEAVKKKRLHRLNELQNRISAEINAGWVGRTVEVLIEGPSKKDPAVLSSRTSGNKIVLLRGSDELAGRFATARITGSTSFWLEGEILEVEDPTREPAPLLGSAHRGPAGHGA